MPKLSLIAAWLDAHGAYLLALLPALVVAWKAMPAATRAALEARFPRATGLVRFVAAVAPDVLGALRIAKHQVIAGEPRDVLFAPRNASPELRASVRAGTSGVTPEPIEPRRGFARTDVLAWGALAAFAAFTAVALAGCPLPAPDGCTPLATRCSPSGVPQSCSPTQRWTSGALQNPCSQRALGAVCCRTRSPYSNETHACAPQSACLPDPAGPTSAPATLAVTQ